MDQQAVRVRLVDPAALHVEERVLRERTGGCAVAAQDVVAVDLEAGLLSTSAFSDSRRFLSSWCASVFTAPSPHEHRAAEDSLRLVVEDALVVEAALAVRLGVVNVQVVVDVLRPGADVQSAQADIRTGVVQHHREVVPRQRRPRREDVEPNQLSRPSATFVVPTWYASRSSSMR